MDQIDFHHSHIEREFLIAAPRERVFEALTREANCWWALRMAEGRTVTLESFPGGRLCETDLHGGGFLWGIVLEIKPPEILHIVEPYASVRPGMLGSFLIRLEEADEKTLVKLDYHCSGKLDPDCDELNTQGWEQVLGVSLKRFVENGEACKPVLV